MWQRHHAVIENGKHNAASGAGHAHGLNEANFGSAGHILSQARPESCLKLLRGSKPGVRREEGLEGPRRSHKVGLGFARSSFRYLGVRRAKKVEGQIWPVDST